MIGSLRSTKHHGFIGALDLRLEVHHDEEINHEVIAQDAPPARDTIYNIYNTCPTALISRDTLAGEA